MLGGAQRQVNVRVLEVFISPFRHRAERSLAQVSVDGAIDATAVSHSGTYLPVGEAYLLNNVVDVGHDALDDDVGVFTLGGSKQVGECFLGSIALFFARYFLLRFNDFLGNC